MGSPRDEGSQKLVGRLLRSYREDSTHGGGRLSQDTLLYLMSVHNGVQNGVTYTAKYTNSDVSRWEDGKNQIPPQVLEDFCIALGISRTEKDHLFSLSGRDTEGEEASPATSPLVVVLKDSVHKIVPPGGYAGIGGFSLGALGLDGTQSLLSYSVGMLALVTGLGVWRWRKADEVIGDLFFVSILFLLNTPLLLSAVTGMDPYGFYSLPAIGLGAFPFMLAILMNLVLSVLAWSLFLFLKQWLYDAQNRVRTTPLVRAIGTALPPTLLVYGITMLFTVPIEWIYTLVILGVLFGAFAVIMTITDPDVRLSEWEAKWAPVVAIEVIIVLCSFGVVGTLVVYLDPSLIAFISDPHNVFWAWELDFEALGYSDNEFIERFRVGIVWRSLAAISFLAILVGSYLLVTIRGAARQQTAGTA